jgi:hypothetical protein
MYKKLLMRFAVLTVLSVCLTLVSSFGANNVSANNTCQEDCKHTYETCVNGCPNEVCVHACKVAYEHCLACCDIACWP